jgi:hypothetical protein
MLIADDSASPEHFSVIFPATCGSSEPQRALRSAGLGCTLKDCQIGTVFSDLFTTYPKAASKQAGGVARATRTKAKITVKMTVDEAYMVIGEKNTVVSNGLVRNEGI